ITVSVSDGGLTVQDRFLLIVEPVIAAAGATITSESFVPSNGAVDPGETVTVDFSLLNTGSLDTTNLVATLLPTGGVTSPSGSQPYGAVIAGGSAVTLPFSFTVDSGVLCGSMVTATLQLQDGAANLGVVTYTFQVGSFALVTYSTADISTPIVDVS